MLGLDFIPNISLTSTLTSPLTSIVSSVLQIVTSGLV